MLSRKSELLAAIETTEGTPPTLTSSNYFRALNPTCNTPQDVEDRVVAGPSLSPDAGLPGRSSVTMGFELDTYNLGTLTPVEDPFLRACGLRGITIPYCTVSGTPTASTWAGMALTDGATGTATLAAPVGTSGRMYFVGAAGGFPGGTTISANAGAATITLTSATPAGTCIAYTPDSTPTALVNLTGAWTGVTPVTGEIVSNGLGGALAARGVVVTAGSGAMEIQPILPHAEFLSGQTVTGLTGGGTNTVDTGGQVLLRVPSMTIRYNIDGFFRLGTGMRGNIALDLVAGQIGTWQIEMQGQLYSSGDTPLLPNASTVALSNLPRWQNAFVDISGFEIPLSRMNVSAGANVALLADAHSANGVRGSSITSREPVLTADFDRVPAAVLDYQTRMQGGTMSSVFSMWGNTVGLRNAVWIPRGQIYQIDDGDREGVATADLTVRPKRRTAAGDDEIYYMFGV